MNTYLLMFLISLSTFIGTVIVFFIDNKKEKILGHLLGLSCGIIIALLVFDIFGFVISKLLDKFVPAHHVHKKDHDSKSKNLFHVGIITLIGIMLHNITEGVALYTVLENNTEILAPFIIGIIIHNIPLGIALSSPIYYSTNDKMKTLLYTCFATISTLIGGFIGFIFSPIFVKFNLPIYILGVTSGMLIYVVFDELLPTAIKYNKKYYISLSLGIIVMALLSII